MKKLSFGAPALAAWIALGACVGIAAGCAASGEGDAESHGNGGPGNGSGGGGSAGGVNDQGDGSHVGDDGCESISKVADVVPPNIMFLVDSSASMNEDTPSRWSVLKPEIVTAIGSLPDDSAVGIIYFPGSPEDNQCLGEEVAVPMSKLGADTSLTSHREKIKNSLLSTQPYGGTPTHDGFYLARVEIQTEKERGVLEGNWFIIMVTDGEATDGRYCSSTLTNAELIVDVEESARDYDVRTFVIGAPGSDGNGSIDDDFRPVLSAMAKAGGMAPAGCFTSTDPYCHWDLSASQDLGTSLQEAFAEITGAITCELTIPPPPAGETFNEEEVKMLLTDDAGNVSEIPWNKDVTGTCPSNATGAFWIYSSDKKSIILCDEACGAAKAVTSGRLDVSFGCLATIY